MERIRSFLAVDISPLVRSRAADLIGRLRGTQTKVKWVETQNLHLTLKFLGEVPNVEIPQVCQTVAQAVASQAPFNVTFHGAGAFPQVHNPRTIWIGVEQGEQELVELHTAMDVALADLGFARENRTYRPHLTIGRVREGGGPQRRMLSELIEKNADFEAASSLVTEVVVYASFLDKHGPTYNVLGRAPLEG